jgi:hypothetical protein
MVLLFSDYGACDPHNQASLKLVVSSGPSSSNFRGPFRRPYILAQQTTLSARVKRKVEKKVQAIGSELPIFVKALTTTNIDGGGKSLGEVVRLYIYSLIYSCKYGRGSLICSFLADSVMKILRLASALHFR